VLMRVCIDCFHVTKPVVVLANTYRCISKLKEWFLVQPNLMICKNIYASLTLFTRATSPAIVSTCIFSIM